MHGGECAFESTSISSLNMDRAFNYLSKFEYREVIKKPLPPGCAIIILSLYKHNPRTLLIDNTEEN